MADGSLALRFDFEDAATCPNGLDNGNVQTGSATAVVNFPEDSILTVSWTGYGEVVSPGYEIMKFSVDGKERARASSYGPAGDPGGVQSLRPCRVGQVFSHPMPPISLPLSNGIHNITVSLNTRDGSHHEGAFYTFSFSLSDNQ